MKKMKWSKSGSYYTLGRESTELESLPFGIYQVAQTKEGPLVEQRPGGFEFPTKLYGVETGFIDRVAKTFAATKDNMGVLLTGLRGTGKTVTAELIAVKFGLPVIMITQDIPGLIDFMDSIPHPVTFFVDEFEKVFASGEGVLGGQHDRGGSKLLPVMDGALNSAHKRGFILTTNKLSVDENFLQRPGRIRYLKTFRNLSRSMIEMIVSDLLDDKEAIPATINFIAKLEIITMDIVTAIAEELNIHGGNPEELDGIFNVCRLRQRYDVKFCDIETMDETAGPYCATVSPEEVDDDAKGYSLTINHRDYGIIEKVSGEYVTTKDEDLPEGKEMRIVRLIARDNYNAASFGRNWKPEDDGKKVKTHKP